MRNLREISPTVYFNAEGGMSRCCPICATIRRYAPDSFSGCTMFFGAALSPFVWNSLDELAVQETDPGADADRPGATETAPFSCRCGPHQPLRPCRASSLGNDAKLIPNNGKPKCVPKANVTPGY